MITISKIRAKIKSPYYIDTSVSFNVKQAFIFALFVFLFLAVFQPFQINAINYGIVWVALSFALVTLFTMLLLNVGVPILFHNYFKEEKWNVGKEIFHNSLNIWLIGFFNFLLFSWLYASSFYLSAWLWFQMITFAVGVIPVISITFYKEAKRQAYFFKQSQLLTSYIDEAKSENNEDVVNFTSKNKNEDLALALSSLYFIKSLDNYVEIYFHKKSLQKRLIRNTLKSIEEEFHLYPYIFRCHKSYIVNLHKVLRISGNAQGYKLHFEGVDVAIPVSRVHNKFIKKWFADGHT